MPTSQSDTSLTIVIMHPACLRCGAQMSLTRIEPDKADHDKRTFACQACGHEHSEVVKFN